MDQLTRAATISALRQRLIDDMNMRRFSRETQRNYIRDSHGSPVSWAVRPHSDHGGPAPVRDRAA